MKNIKIIQNYNETEYQTYKTFVEYIFSENFNQYADNLVKVNFEKYYEYFSTNYLMLQLYNLCALKQKNTLEITKLVCEQYLIKSTINFEQILKRINLTNHKPEQIKMILLILQNQYYFSNQELRTFYESFFLQIPQPYQVAELCNHINQVITQQDAIQLANKIGTIGLNIFNSAKLILNQKKLRNAIFALLDIYFDDQNEYIFSSLQILLNLVVFDQEYHILKFYQICFCKLKYTKLRETVMTSQDNFLEYILPLVQQVLTQLDTEEKILILKTLPLIIPDSSDCKLEFLLPQLNQPSESLILYLQICYYQKISNSILVHQYSQKLYQVNQQFFSKFLKNIINQNEYFCVPEDEINIGKQQGEFYFSLLYQTLQFDVKLEEQKFRKQIQSETINSKDLIGKLDEKFFCSFTQTQQQQFLQYTFNQLLYIQSYAEQVKTDLFCHYDLKIIQSQVYLKQLIKKRERLFFLQQQLKSLNLKSFHYFNEELGLSEIQANLIMYQLFDNFIHNEYIISSKLLQAEYHLLFGENIFFIIDYTGTSEMTIDQIVSYLISKNLEKKQIYCLNSFVSKVLEELNLKINEYSEFHIENLDSLLNNLTRTMIGCLECCPVCKRKCDADHAFAHVHQCQNGHQLRSMSGISIDGKPSLFSCEELEDQFHIRDQNSETIQLWSDVKANYKNWIFTSVSQQQFLNQKAMLTKLWDNHAGEWISQQLKIDFKKRQSLDFQDYRGRNVSKTNVQKIFHYILVLDDSGSMAGTRFNNAKSGAKQCLTYLSLNQDARLSVILFNKQARIVIGENGPEKINANQQINKISFIGGGTDFNQPFLQVYNILQKCIDQFVKHVILFYTDGKAACPESALNALMSLSEVNRKKIQIIICCEGRDQTSIMRIADFFNTKMDNGKLIQEVKPESIGSV